MDASWLSHGAPGVALTVGLEKTAGALRLRPEVRYAWFNRPIYDFGSVRTRQDSLAAVLAIGWARAQK